MTHYDLIIVGGGLVGAGLAVALRHSGLKIALVDARLPSSDDPRLFALNSGSCQFLENLGLWQQLIPYASPIHQVHVSHQGHFGSVRLHREDVNLPTLGHVIPAHYIETALNQALDCTVYRPAKLQQLHQHENIAELKISTENGEVMLQSPIVIGADGTESTVRKQLNIHTEVFDYHQTAIVTKTSLKRSHKQIAYERFNSHGAIAMLPLINDECATIWTADNALINQLMELSDSEFLERLQQEFGYRLGRLQAIQKRHVFPLRMVRAEKAVEKSVFLLGNSAHTLSPIAAQGFNLALYEVALLAESILEKVKLKRVFNGVDLQEISDQTQKQQAVSIGVSHRLSSLFSSELPLMGLATQLGMIGLDVVTPVKKRFIRGMLGRTGRVPSLLLN